MTTISVDTTRNLSDILPVELLVQILSHADFRDIVRCKAVCKSFQSVISNSVVLQYRIELAVAGYVDGLFYGDHSDTTTCVPDDVVEVADRSQTVMAHTQMSQLAVAKRLEKLRRLERAWRDLTFKFVWRHDEVLGSTSIYEFSGGVFVRGSRTDPTRRGASSLQVIVPPSSFHGRADFEPGVEPQSWEHQLGITSARDIGVDPGVDLLVLIEQDPSRYQIHLKMLSFNRPHPLAEHPILVHEPRHPSVDYSFTINVFNEILGIMFCAPPDDRRTSELVIWNWKTGRVLSTFCITNFIAQSFAFLSSYTFLLPHVITRQAPREDEGDLNEDDERLSASLRVYSFGTETSAQSGSDPPPSPTLIATFRMPTFTSNVQACDIMIRSDPQPGPQNFPITRPDTSDPPVAPGPKPPLHSRRKPFYPDPLQRVFVISVSLIIQRTRLMRTPILTQKQYTVFVHSNAFIDLCGRDVIGRGVPPSLSQDRQRTPRSPGNSRSPSSWMLSLLGSSSRSQSVSGTENEEADPEPERDTPLSFEWEAWSKYARWTTLPYRGNFVCYIYGQRYIGWSTSQYDEQELFMWDFNQHTIRQIQVAKHQKAAASHPDPIEFGGADLMDTERPDESGCTVDESELLEKHVFKGGSAKSSLPFRRVSIPFDSSTPCAGVMLDDERIIVIMRHRNTSLTVNVLGIDDDSDPEDDVP